MSTIRNRLKQALGGGIVAEPVYLVYDWFIENRNIDWQSLFDLGLGRVNHVSLVEIEHPNLKVEKTVNYDDKHKREDIRWITDIGELHEYLVDGWRQEYLIKTSNDYRIMQRAMENVRFSPTNTYFDKSEQVLGDSGITLGQLGREVGFSRTPFQVIQIHFTGLEKFSLDIAMETVELMDLLEVMNANLLDAFHKVIKTKATHVKLWENLSIETMGPEMYRVYLVPLYHKIIKILEGEGKKLHVHYDGKLKLISDEISRLGFNGLDSLTPQPEGDMSMQDARRLWPEKFFWMHPSLTWDELPDKNVIENVYQMMRGANDRFCLQLSEEVPPNWRRTIPLILEALQEYA